MGCFIPYKRQAFPVWSKALPEPSALWTFDGTFDDTKGFFSIDMLSYVTLSSNALSGQSLTSSSSAYGIARYLRFAPFIPRHTLCGWALCSVPDTITRCYSDNPINKNICNILMDEQYVRFNSADCGTYGQFDFTSSIYGKWIFVGYTTAGRLFVRILGEEVRFMNDQTGDCLSSWVGVPIEDFLIQLEVYVQDCLEQFRFFWGQELTDEQITQLAYEFD